MGSKEARRLQLSLHGETKAETPWDSKDGFRVPNTWLKHCSRTVASRAVGSWWLKTFGSRRYPAFLQRCIWTSLSQPTGLCPFLLPVLAPDGYSYGHAKPNLAPGLRLLKQLTSGYPAERSFWPSLQQKVWQTGLWLKSGDGHNFWEQWIFSWGTCDLRHSSKISLPEERRNVKMMTQLFLVIEEDNRTRKHWISGTLRRNSGSRNRPRGNSPRKALCWVGFLLLWAFWLLFVWFLFLVILPSLNASLWGPTRGSSCRRSYGTNWQYAASETIRPGSI